MSKKTWTRMMGGVVHTVEQGAQYCSCGQDAVTCQRCGVTFCGEAATWLHDGIAKKEGNHCPVCVTELGLTVTPQTALSRTAREAKAAQELREGRAKLDETLALTFGSDVSIDFVARALCDQFRDQARGRLRDLKSTVSSIKDDEFGDDLRHMLNIVYGQIEEVRENLARYDRAYSACSQTL